VRSKLWLALIIVLVLLALLVGGWIGLLSGKQRWLDDYAAFQSHFKAQIDI
jgi:Tfp pilus assembly protein PilO